MKELFRIQPRKGRVDTIVVYGLGGQYLTAECQRWDIKFYLTDKRPRNYKGAWDARDLFDGEPPVMAKAELSRSGAAHVVSKSSPANPSFYFRSKTFKPWTLVKVVTYVARQMKEASNG